MRRLIGRTFIAKRFGSTSFAARLFNVVFHAATIVLSIMAALTTLYSLGDWMLLGLSILFLVGLAWATKATIPRVFEQVKLMLNLGSVREGERIVFHGVPWKVERINVFTDLVNPSLDGGHMRVPLRDLIPLVSRHSNDDEPYFPCKTNDWVMLADATYGKVVKQTPEWVQLVQLGSARVTYATADFVAQNPKNLSHGFRIHGAFGIDYQHQPICTTEVPKVLLTKLKAGLTEIAGEESLVNLNVEFQQAGPSSLDYAILADFANAAASNHNRLNRAIQRICVDTCNENGWVIPFTQVTIHNAA